MANGNDTSNQLGMDMEDSGEDRLSSVPSRTPDTREFVSVPQRRIFGITTPRIVLLCAESGMGKTTILSRTCIRYMEQGAPARYVDFDGLLPEETGSVLRDVLRWCKRQVPLHKNHIVRGVVACDNMPIGDEVDIARQVAAIRHIVEEGFLIIVSSLPAGELLCERMGEAETYWSCDLLLQYGNTETIEQALFERYTRGIPLLVDACERADEQTRASIQTDPSFQEPYIRLLERSIRHAAMEDERRMRCAMVLLGEGYRSELESILGGIDDVLWRLTARDAPIFGVSVARGVFCTIGTRSHELLNASYAMLCACVRDYPILVAQCARLLAMRGDISRAAIVSLLCSDDYERCSIGLEWGVSMIDSGEVSVVLDALEAARSLGLRSHEAYSSTACVLAALTGSAFGKGPSRGQDVNNSALNRCARLLLACRSLLRGRAINESLESEGEDDGLEEVLVTHARALELIAGGNLHEAYEHLLGSAIRLREPSVFTSLLEIDYLFCSVTMGYPPSEYDMSLGRAAVRLYEQTGLGQLASVCDALLLAASILAGRATDYNSFDAPLQRVTRSGDAWLRGIFLLASSVSDLRIGALTRAHVRLGQAQKAFGSDGLDAYQKMARLLHCGVKAQLGERVLRSEFESCKGVSRVMDGVTTMLESAVLDAKPRRYSSTSGWGVLSHVPEVHWIINVLLNDCGGVSKRFRKVLPSTWTDSQIRSTSAIDELKIIGSFGAGEGGPEEQEVVKSGRTVVGSMVEVCMLGGFEVYASGALVPSNRLEKRRAKALLALLAAVPGHVAKRYAIMETIWPTYDYQSANKCVYSSTSVLRAEIGLALENPQELPVVITNKAQGTVSLNAEVVGCDVDLFEKKARELLDMDGQDREVVVLCREIEELYKGDLFVPPTDGMGIIETRSRELKALFADAMIAGASSALRIGMKTLACRFARKAHDSDELREDAMRVLAISLCAAGRHVEAERTYELFVGRVVDLTRCPPSRRLREVVEELFKGVSSSTVEATEAHKATLGLGSVRVVTVEEEPESEQLSFGFDEEEEEERGVA